MASTPAGMPHGTGKIRKRPRELEDPLNHFLYHPLAATLARLLQPTGISPNAVSVLGMLSIWAAAACYFLLPWPQAVLFGLSFHMLWHVIDGADGDLARLTGKSSPTGELVDGFCDYAGHAPLYFALAAMADDQIGLWAWPLGVLAAASHGVQANHSETQRRSYLWWAYGVPWLKTHSDREASTRGFARISAWAERFYLWTSRTMNPNLSVVDRAMAKVGPDPRARRLVRTSSRYTLKFQKALGSNPRTLLVGLCLAFGSPLAYFLSQILLLNLLLLVSVRVHDVAGRRLARKLAQLSRD
ncbi:MAG: CDP-alcohol phosphatidyltransferase family protein [Allosphingosinicella sp.]